MWTEEKGKWLVNNHAHQTQQFVFKEILKNNVGLAFAYEPILLDITFKGKERHAKTTFVWVKLRAVYKRIFLFRKIPTMTLYCKIKIVKTAPGTLIKYKAQWQWILFLILSKERIILIYPQSPSLPC